MSKFNQSTISKRITTNNEGAVAYSMGDKEKLITQVLTSLFNEQKFYGDNSNDLVETAKKVISKDARFIANLALYARREMHLRSISHVLTGELSHANTGKQYTRVLINQVVERPDDMLEIMAYITGTYGKPIPNSVKKGMAEALKKFNEYQFAKYNRQSTVKLKDILSISHPKPDNDEQSELWKRILEDSLQTPETWETKLSLEGNKQESWESLIAGNKLGYMAALRNLRNIINSGASNIDKVYGMLADENNVFKSKQLPFRFYSAYRILQQEGIGTSKVYNVLERAIKASTKNMEQIKGKTLIAADVSGSMTYSNISEKSDVRPANYICEEAITVCFDTNLYVRPMPSEGGIISNAQSIPVNGGGTNITLPFQYLIQKNIFVDRIVVLSDNELNRKYSFTCQHYVEQYKKINPNVWVHGIDLQGYGTQQFMGKNVNLISGWSEKVFDFINTAEFGLGTMLNKIEGYYF